MRGRNERWALVKDRADAKIQCWLDTCKSKRVYYGDVEDDFTWFIFGTIPGDVIPCDIFQYYPCRSCFSVSGGILWRTPSLVVGMAFWPSQFQEARFANYSAVGWFETSIAPVSNSLECLPMSSHPHWHTHENRRCGPGSDGHWHSSLARRFE